MNKIIKNFAEFLRTQNLPYDFVGDNNAIRVTQKFEKNPSSHMLIFVLCDDDDANDIQIALFGLGKVENMSVQLLQKINEINAKYRWFKLAITEDWDLRMTLDAYVDGNVNEQILAYILRAVDIADDLYPQLMKIIWS